MGAYPSRVLIAVPYVTTEQWSVYRWTLASGAYIASKQPDLAANLVDSTCQMGNVTVLGTGVIRGLYGDVN